VLKVRLYRPFSAKHLLRAAGKRPRIAVLDRTKEPGAH
jgi:pyruvate-ferredoxin/flavodoxin oxidoreductase